MRRVARFGELAVEVSAESARDARDLAHRLRSVDGVLEVVVGWDRVLCHAREVVTDDLVRAVAERASANDAALDPTPREHVVRVVYDGVDLRELADACALAPEEVARRHAIAYDVEVIGFLPGFAYLGAVDPTIARPRRPTPRTRVDAGTVAIAGPRTAIYPLSSPGGWNLVGRAVDCTPFDRERGALFAVGDRVRFVVEDVCPR